MDSLNKQDKLLEKMLDFFKEGWYNKVCWRCGSKFYHGFSDTCNKCDKELKDGLRKLK